VLADAALADQERPLARLVVFLAEHVEVGVPLAAHHAVVARVRARQRGHWLAWSPGCWWFCEAAPGPAGSIRPGVAGVAETGPGGGQLALGPLGPLAQLGAGLLQDPGAVLERHAQFLPLAGGVGAGLGVLGGRVGQALLGGLPADDGVGQAAGDLLPWALGSFLGAIRDNAWESVPPRVLFPQDATRPIRDNAPLSLISRGHLTAGALAPSLTVRVAGR
jgi:hypothetical protein